MPCNVYKRRPTTKRLNVKLSEDGAKRLGSEHAEEGTKKSQIKLSLSETGRKTRRNKSAKDEIDPPSRFGIVTSDIIDCNLTVVNFIEVETIGVFFNITKPIDPCFPSYASMVKSLFGDLDS